MLIFSKERFWATMKGIVSEDVRWPNECDGKEVVDCRCEGYMVLRSWCVEKNQTNFDRITASPEALVEYIMSQPCSDHHACCDCWGYKPVKKCGEKMIEWLNQEVSEG